MIAVTVVAICLHVAIYLFTILQHLFSIVQLQPISNSAEEESLETMRTEVRDQSSLISSGFYVEKG